MTQPKEEPKKEEPKEEPPPTKPNTITLAFAAHGPGPDGTVQGTFTYVITQGPIDANVSHLGPNVVYQLETWDITVDSGIEDMLPSTRYNHDQIGNSAEFCVGICVFSSSSVIKVTFKNETNRILLGMPIEKGIQKLSKSGPKTITKVTKKSLEVALDAALLLARTRWTSGLR